ncbi:hypothetical protein [Pseudomonas sp. BF61]|uniref:hypothetical protein n=1 Tax=Pseudomonas sp. BF61 TaxID=2741068 RepID=UPI00209BA1B7|nr:hypothetical protein [Pseudomonas sp. BF61]
MKDCVFQVGELSVTGKFDGDVFVILTFITNACFTVLGHQRVKVRTDHYSALDDLFYQLLFKLTIFTVKIVTLVTGQHASGVFNISANMFTR